MEDLRSFLSVAEKAGELSRVDRETDPLTEMGALFGETEHPLLFEKVRGYPGWQICGELITTRRSSDYASIEESYDPYAKRIMTDPPIPSASAFRAAIEYVGRDHPSAAKLRPEDLYETSLVESAVARLGR